MTDSPRDLAAETITVRIRWFGLCLGVLVVNFLGRETNAAVLNAILFLGALYTLTDTLFSWRGRVFLSAWPLVISGMEAVFIGLLCYFDSGLSSPFRFYYVLSLLVCAFRHSRQVTWTTFALHSVSYAALFWTKWTLGGRTESVFLSDLPDFLLTLVVMGWVTWAGAALSGLLRTVSERLRKANASLTENQTLLEERIAERTEALQESQALLVQQEKQAAFGLLAAGIAHEVGNPLAAISSLVQMLNRREQDDYTRERLQMVDDQLARIQRTLRELVDFSRPVHTQVTRCDVRDVIGEALSIAKYYKGKKGKRVETSFVEPLPTLLVVRDQLVQVLLNLVLNAMDATDEGGLIELAAFPRLRSREDIDGGPGDLVLRVTDSGAGISEEKQARLFDPYYTTKPHGTGLGLFVCRKILDGMHGAIRLVSGRAGGTTFELTLSGPAVEFPSPLPSEMLDAIAASGGIDSDDIITHAAQAAPDSRTELT